MLVAYKYKRKVNGYSFVLQRIKLIHPKWVLSFLKLSISFLFMIWNRHFFTCQLDISTNTWINTLSSHTKCDKCDRNRCKVHFGHIEVIFSTQKLIKYYKNWPLFLLPSQKPCLEINMDGSHVVDWIPNWGKFPSLGPVFFSVYLLTHYVARYHIALYYTILIDILAQSCKHIGQDRVTACGCCSVGTRQ